MIHDSTAGVAGPAAAHDRSGGRILPPMRRLALVAALALLTAACVAQRPPERSPLPDVEEAVAPARPCAFAVGPGRGVEIREVFDGTAADGTLEPGDRIVSVDGTEVTTAVDLRRVLSTRRPGDAITIEVLRDGDALTIPLVLGSGPGDEPRPFIGITIVTVYEEVVLSEVPDGEGLEDPYARLVAVEGRVYALDPVNAQVVATGLEAPPPPWYGAGGRLYRVRDGELVDDEGRRVPLPFEFGALLGSLDARLVVAGTRADGTVVVGRTDPRSGEADWVYEPPPELGLPVGSITAPGDGRLLLGLSDPASGEITFVILDGGSGEPTGEAVRVFDGGVVLGWFDAETLLGQDPSGALLLLDVVTGTVTGASLPVAPGPGVAVWPVGDGVRVLIRDGGTLSVGGLTPGVENRPLVRRCRIEYVDEVGSGRLR